MKLPDPIVLVLGGLAPVLLAFGANVHNPALQVVIQVLGIVCAGLSGHAMPQPSWAVGKAILPAGVIAGATPIVAVLYQIASVQPAGVMQTLLYAVCCALAYVAGLHAPSPLPAVAVAK